MTPTADYRCVTCGNIENFDTKVGSTCFADCGCAKRIKFFSRYRKRMHLEGMKLYVRVWAPVNIGKGEAGGTPPRGAK